MTATDGTDSSTVVTVNVNDVTEAVAPPTPTGGLVLDFEGFPDNGDGTFALDDAEFPSYGGVGRGLVTITEVDRFFAQRAGCREWRWRRVVVWSDADE